MCGLAGFLQLEAFRPDEAKCTATKMAQQIATRGPDDSGIWVDADATLALAHRRLAIVDLSAAGHQPMHSPNGRYVIAYNGEIYNHLALRTELDRSANIAYSAIESGQDRINWRGHSDTETLLAGFEAWGLEATLKNHRHVRNRCVGQTDTYTDVSP